MSLTTTDKQDIKGMIKDGTAHLASTSFVKKEINRLETKINKVAVLVEDTNVDVKKMLGMLSNNLKVKTQVDDHETRLTEIEANQPSIISTLALHSKQLKA